VAEQPVITNVLASRVRRARICNSTPETLGRDVYEAMKARQKPVVISSDEAPVKELVKTGDSINLFEFPTLVHNSMDAGYYFTAGFVTTYDPDSGIDNCAIQRGWIKEKDTVRIWIDPSQHNGFNLSKYEKRNQDMRVAIWQGHHPLAFIGGLNKMPYPSSHFEKIGGMLGEPLRLVASESLGDDFMVPADAEIVVEGTIEANKRYAEGPFGETTRIFGGQLANPQLKVTAITHRKDSIWYDVAAGWSDHAGSGGFSLEGELWNILKGRFPSLQNVYLPMSGVGRFHAYLQFKNPLPADARRAIMIAISLFGGGFVKHVFAFDDDVDIFDDREAMWAIATRSQWDRDVIIAPRIKIKGVDPSAQFGTINCAGGIDCTKPSGEPFEEKIFVDQDVMSKINLDDYIPADVAEKIRTERM
jgi:2,5-furandicarboxylate decarboxylase 1